MKNKILIRTSDRKTLHKDRRSLGINGENLQEVLLFCLEEKIEGNGIVEVELPNGEKGMIEVDRTEEGYELPVKSSLLTQTGFVKFQLRILHDDVEIFKSEIIALEVKDSINATASIPEEYPSWVDVLENLKQDLEKSESERVSNENKRQSAEKTRQENFTKMQETVSNAVSNIKDLTEEYNSNAEKETKKFNDNAVEQTKTFNDNSDSKLAEYNKNHTDKIKEYDGNSKAKLDAYNKNNTDKTNAYNDNTVLKEKAYNDNAADKVKEYNTNVEQKETELEKLAEKKINEYNQVSAELTAKVEQVQTENEALKAENNLIKEQIPSASMSGNSIHIEDSGTLDFDWKIRGGHKQKTREGYQLLNLQNGTQNGITYYVDSEGYFYISGTCTSDRITLNLNEIVLNGTYTFTNKSISGGEINCVLKDNTSEYKNIFTKNNETKEVNTILKDLVCYLTNGVTYNSKIKLMLVSGSQEKDIEKYGASPSPDYPSEIKTVKDNVEIDVVNKNLLNIANTEETTKDGITYSIKNGILKLNGTTTSNLEIQLSKNIKIKKGKYTHSSSYIQSGLYISFDNLMYTMIRATVGKKITFELTEDTTYKRYFIWIDKGTLLNNVEIKLQLEVGDTATDFVKHQSQTAIRTIQQEMLEEDYIADVEHHEWKKLIITGEENIIYYDAPSTEVANNLNTAYFTVSISEKAQGNSNNIISNMFKNLYTASGVWGNASSTSESLKESIAVDTSIRLRINKNRLQGYDNSQTSNEKVVLLKTYLKSLYDAGNPVIIRRIGADEK